MPAPTLSAAFRFDRKAGRRLQQIADGLRSLSPDQLARQNVDVSFYDKAAESAQTGEPLIVRFTDPLEIDLMRQALTDLGITDQGIDNLNG